MKIFKVIFLVSILFLLLYNSGFCSNIETSSSIKAVTVYSSSALVTRIADIKVDKGTHNVILPDIMPGLDENSLRVSGQGTAEVKILGAQVKKEFLKDTPVERVRVIQEEIQRLSDELKKTGNLKAILSEEKQYLDSVRLFSDMQIPKDLVTKVPSVKDLEDTLKFLDVKLKENLDQSIALDLNAREVQKKLEALKNELDRLLGPQEKLKIYIVVELDVLKAGDISLEIAYLVNNASWYPVYDARASFDKASVELISYGVITQSTGEDWKDIELTLSTAKPNLYGSLPEIYPWFLRPYQPSQLMYESKEIAADVAMQSSVERSLNNTEDRKKAETAYATSQEKGTAVTYGINHKASIKSDGQEYKLGIFSQVLEASFEYSSYPKAEQFAFLGSKVTNSKNLQLIQGRLSVFLEGDYIGSSWIKDTATGEMFDLYLGIDENVKVKRELVEKKVDDVLIGNIPSSTRSIKYKYKLSVENYKSKNININLFEAMPVSENQQIKVKINNVSLEPKERDWSGKKGVWKWALELQPKEKKEIFYTYIIEHPRDMVVEGL